MTAVTNQSISDRLGMSLSAVSRLRNGKRSPSIHTILRLNREFGLPVEDLVHAAAQSDKGEWCALLAPIFAEPASPTDADADTKVA